MPPRRGGAPQGSGGKASASSSGALSGDGDQYDGLSVANCDKQQIGSTLMTYANSMPIRHDLQDVFSAILEQVGPNAHRADSSNDRRWLPQCNQGSTFGGCPYQPHKKQEYT